MKRWKYSLEELNCLYERLVAKAIQKFNNQDYNSAVKCIKSAANFQYHFNNIYNDKRLDNLLESISKKCYYGLSDYESSDFVFFSIQLNFEFVVIVEFSTDRNFNIKNTNVPLA